MVKVSNVTGKDLKVMEECQLMKWRLFLPNRWLFSSLDGRCSVGRKQNIISW